MPTIPRAAWEPRALYVLRDVLRERASQVARYGLNEDLDFGTGPGVAWLAPLSLEPAAAVQQRFRQFYEDYEEDTGKPTWSLLIREELAETLEVPDTDLERLRAEAIQTAALLVSMCAQIDARLGVEPIGF